ncbi:MAG: thiamine phosphate synthase [Acidimicrobiales bacterium]
MIGAGRTRSSGLGDRRLYLCTPDREDLEAFVAACLSGGVDIVQLRDKNLDDAALVKRGKVIGALCADFGALFMVNDRPDLATEAGAHGVHLGQGDMHPADARQMMGPDAIIGISTHQPADLARAGHQPVDYASVGPVVATPTKPGRPGTGPAYVHHAASSWPRPWFVTGGVSPASVAALAAAGARRFVVVRWLTEAVDPEAAARELLGAIDRALAGVPATT